MARPEPAPPRRSARKHQSSLLRLGESSENSLQLATEALNLESRPVCNIVELKVQMREQFIASMGPGEFEEPSNYGPSSAGCQNTYAAVRDSIKHEIILPDDKRGIFLNMVDQLEREVPLFTLWGDLPPADQRDLLKVLFPLWNDAYIINILGTIKGNAYRPARNLRSGSSASTSSTVSLCRFQEIGMRALDSEIDITIVCPLDDSKAEIHWPIKDWITDLTPGKSMELMLEGMEFRDCTFELVNTGNCESVCGKGSKPDMVLRLKGHNLATYCTGAVICLHSKGVGSRMDNLESIGEAVLYGRQFLKEAGPLREFIFVGVTDLKEVIWFRISESGNYFTRTATTTKVRQSLCAFLCAAPATLGLQVDSQELKLPTAWKWKRTLGFGRTSIVYEMEKDNVPYAVKVPQHGSMLTEDFVCLSVLKDVAGVPTVCAQLGGMLALQPVGEPFDCKTIKKHGLAHSFGQLVDILKEAHSREVVNRDIRVENIMIAESRLYILDWGFGTTIDAPDSFSGCFYTASDDVLNQFISKTENVQVVFKAADDLVALVRCLFMLFQEDSSNQLKHLYSSLSNSELPQRLLDFWKNQMRENPSWKTIEHHAVDVDYDSLRANLDRVGDFL